MRTIFLTFLVLTFTSTLFTQSVDLKKLVEEESLFAKYALDNGVGKAFIKFLAADGLVFKPNATNGFEFYKNKVPSNEIISWQPKFADISANYALGYTTGDWQCSKEKSEPPTFFGQYVSIWQKQQNGEYKVILDIGISHEKPKTVDSKVTFGESGSEKPTRFASFLSDESVSD
jgi:ketosteroid isomerase-like protein